MVNCPALLLWWGRQCTWEKWRERGVNAVGEFISAVHNTTSRGPFGTRTRCS